MKGAENGCGDVILVRKKFLMAASKRQGRRQWQLKRLQVNADDTGLQKMARMNRNEERDMEIFQQDLEEDPDLRRDVKLFKKKNKGRRERGEEDGADAADDAADAKQAGGAGTEGADAGADMDDEDEDECPEVPMDELVDLMGELTVGCGGGAEEEEEELSSDDDL